MCRLQGILIIYTIASNGFCAAHNAASILSLALLLVVMFFIPYVASVQNIKKKSSAVSGFTNSLPVKPYIFASLFPNPFPYVALSLITQKKKKSSDTIVSHSSYITPLNNTSVN